MLRRRDDRHGRAGGLGLESASDGATAALRSWNEQRDRAAFPAYELPEVSGGVLREEVGRLFAEYVERNPNGGALTAWARTLASA
jgi:hypothetical protein